MDLKKLIEKDIGNNILSIREFQKHLKNKKNNMKKTIRSSIFIDKIKKD
jgi:hypothetical protein